MKIKSVLSQNIKNPNWSLYFNRVSICIISDFGSSILTCSGQCQKKRSCIRYSLYSKVWPFFVSMSHKTFLFKSKTCRKKYWTQPVKFFFSFPGRQDFFFLLILVYCSHRILLFGCRPWKWAIVLSESRFLTFENKVSD